MKFATLTSALSLAASALAATTLPVINITGNAFWNTDTGDRFYIRGVDYQPGGSSNLTDPLADVSICSRDIPYFQELGLNTIRVYSVDNTQDHDSCMQLLADAGIYVVIDVNTPGASISRTDPGCSYNADYLQNVFATVDMFQNYTNVLGFFAGNEVINTDDTLFTAPYVKAVVRDIKKYLSARKYRQIPVGYSAADVATVRLEVAEYFNCGNDSNARIDMLGVNDYSWCGHSSFSISGYQEKVKMYTGYSVPIFLSEYGCNEVKGARPFTEVESIYSTQMSSVFSGGLVYEYSEEGSDYGLVDLSSSAVETTTDFTNLKAELNKTSDPTGDGGYLADGTISECPTDWNFTITVPDTPEGAEIYFKEGAGEGSGFDADTQDSCDADAYYISSTNTPEPTSSKVHTSSARASVSSAAATSSAATSSSATSTSSSSSKGGAASIDATRLTSVIALFVAALFA